MNSHISLLASRLLSTMGANHSLLIFHFTVSVPNKKGMPTSKLIEFRLSVPKKNDGSTNNLAVKSELERQMSAKHGWQLACNTIPRRVVVCSGGVLLPPLTTVWRPTVYCPFPESGRCQRKYSLDFYTVGNIIGDH